MKLWETQDHLLQGCSATSAQGRRLELGRKSTITLAQNLGLLSMGLVKDHLPSNCLVGSRKMGCGGRESQLSLPVTVGQGIPEGIGNESKTEA
jgi:hypothetical protein